MKILIIGSGGREHSLVWAFLQNPKCKEIHCIPGNAGIEKIAICKDLNILNNREIVSYCKSNKIDFVVVGPEAPLANGLIDILIKNKILCFGPTKEAALLESSKSFTKSICDKRNIPTANYVLANSKKEALGFIEKFKPPFVIKLDGLAAGKGVFISKNKSDVRVAVTGASENGVFRWIEMEESLSNDWSKSSIENIKLSPEGIMSDIHGSSEYRANLVNIMAIRAFEGINE